ncbi:uncharacterized protein BDCG_09266 [Blastomyces dermatitidis ER-3]|uniref:Uncharacterized protein n=1 Tax=Ajellomyces dermatitidis (strain ER-3 / ATCC MYA-2586) TaxID=559297 RepID=A0ABP2EQT7_AJEDR|nr:uncharacterized protein BDCG_09266 [Blastomyces dermatitidis ER-3]EEQ85997.1 hypothetical protein BDCG_09266 [Blastomyces dermatitidis ER-3]EQL29515.1 hypothetical protein BDFG_07832 [Blastomyces dermatitidis ATCC 26199]
MSLLSPREYQEGIREDLSRRTLRHGPRPHFLISNIDVDGLMKRLTNRTSNKESGERERPTTPWAISMSYDIPKEQRLSAFLYEGTDESDRYILPDWLYGFRLGIRIPIGAG